MSWLNPIRITNRSEVVFEDSISTRDKRHFRHRCTYKHHRGLFYMGNGSYGIVAPDTNSDLYRKLAKDYWNWVQGKKPDSDPKNPNDPNVTFLRDDIIGGPLKHEVGIDSWSEAERGPPCSKEYHCLF